MRCLETCLQLLQVSHWHGQVGVGALVPQTQAPFSAAGLGALGAQGGLGLGGEADGERAGGVQPLSVQLQLQPALTQRSHLRLADTPG